MEEMASAMITHMQKVRPNGPYAIAGYSSGGILAFEITKQLMSSGYRVSFLGLIDTYATIINPLSETEFFLTFLRRKFSVFEAFNDSIWWDRASKLTLNDAIEMIRETNLNLNSADIEWEALLSKQRFNYQNICQKFKIDFLPSKIHLFKAVEHHEDDMHRKIKHNVIKSFNLSKLGWENYNQLADFNVVSVDGNHSTMITDPKNRSSLGAKLTKSLFFIKFLKF